MHLERLAKVRRRFRAAAGGDTRLRVKSECAAELSGRFTRSVLGYQSHASMPSLDELPIIDQADVIEDRFRSRRSLDSLLSHFQIAHFEITQSASEAGEVGVEGAPRDGARGGTRG